MTRSQRLRRAGILCCHCLRNLAFYRAGWREGEPIFKDQFWKNANGNFLNICVLEWCKLFGDLRDKHYWEKIISKQENFFKGMLVELNITDTEFNDYKTEMRTYRDKFIAHLDDEEIMHPPRMELTLKSVSYLYNYLLAHENTDGTFDDALMEASTFYQRFLKEGKSVYDKHAT